MSVISDTVHINGGLHNQPLGAAFKGEGGVVVGQDSLGAPHKLAENNETYKNNNLLGPSQNGGHSDTCGQDASGDAHAEESPEIDIIINNVVCTFGTRCHLNLKRIAMEGAHVEYKRENGMLNMKLRRPNATATIWSSGKITCTGSTRLVFLQGSGVFFYEPELHPGVTYRIKEPRATLKIFSTGSITVTAPCVLNVQLAIEHIYPLVCQFKMESSRIDKKVVLAEKKYFKKGGAIISNPMLQMVSDDEEDEFLDEEELGDEESEFSEDFDSDVSCD
ncbi:TATA-box-binding protein [Aplysia californica]|uniref:TATA-box-binding protein n=1 Tax=Aplysia californica TaxID=6500 RepID=A0ABM1W0G1_APLCA|nr:TATA-box-binding protein [Aplysia californica]